MKHLAVGAVVIALSGPVFAAETFAPYESAQNPWSGDIEGYLGGIRVDDDGNGLSGFTFGGASRVNYNFNQHWNIQGDLVYDQISVDDDFITRLSTYGAAAHAYWRSQNFALGAFGTINGYDNNVLLPDFTRWTVGVEGQAYLDRLTLYGQLYGGRIHVSEPGFSESFDLWGIRGVARYFFTDNFRLDGELAYETIDIFSVDETRWVAALQANYRFDNSPLTVFGRYQYENVSVDDVDQDLDMQKFVVGLRITFNRDTLLGEDRTGATMDTIRHNLPLPFLVD